ncbi:dihydrofolate reductase family protein [Nocardia halotolerans]|uniref:Dihydrofolate reductase family protein n=1 Tax=Nocardia halotolerans TaxID=1755878 RepID=A0ABV8VL14_9NOCA
MRKLVYYIGASIDGYIAGPGGEVDFYPVTQEYAASLSAEFPEAIPTHLRAQIGMDVDTPNRNWDTVLMGRGTYEPGLAEGAPSPFAHLKQYVFSTTLEQQHPDVEIVAGDPVAFVRELKQRDGGDIWLCGGGKLAGQLLDEIDELILKSYPVIAGDGIPAFTGVFKPSRFTPLRRKQFDNGAQVTWFERA